MRRILYIILPAALLALLLMLAGRLSSPSPGGSGTSSSQGSAGGGRPEPVPLDIRFTCDVSGRIEPCGCFSGQYGGLTRVSTVLASAPVGALKLDAGNAIAGTADFQILQFRQLLAALARMGWQAVNLGGREASLPAVVLRDLVKNSPVPLISANVLDAASKQPLAAPFHVVTIGGLRVAIIGVVDPAAAQPEKSVVVEEPNEALSRTIPEAGKAADVLVCLAFADESGLEQIARKFYELPVILGGNVQQPFRSVRQVNQSWILATTNQSRALGELRSSWDPVTRRLAPATGRITLMSDDIPQDPLIAAFSSNYRREVRAADLGIDHPGESGDAIPGVQAESAYAGSESCAACHAGAFAAWKKSGHAHAFESLVRKDSDADPSCISCHTVGFGERGGYLRSMKAERLTQVGCESCHGPASAHIAARSAAALHPSEAVLQRMRPVGPGQCVQCHHGEFSRPFDYSTFWPLIQHGKEPVR